MASDTRALVRRVQEQILSIDEMRQRRDAGTLPPSTLFAASVLVEVMGWGTLSGAGRPARGDRGRKLLLPDGLPYCPGSEGDDVLTPMERESQPEHEPLSPMDLSVGATVRTEPEDVSAPFAVGALEEPVFGVHGQSVTGEGNPAGEADA